MAGILSKKKDRKKSDVQGDPVDHFFQKVLEDSFSNTEYVMTPPNDIYYNEFPDDEKGGWDPKHVSVFEHERSALWLRSTWDEYLRPKYKKALDKWNKDTGGGDGTPTSFINFCGGDRWLVYLFCKDLEANFLLASNAGGRMPKHLQVESGFSEDVSSLGDDGGSSGAERTIAVLEDELSEYKKQRVQWSGTMEKLVGYLENKNKSSSEEKSDTMDRYLSQVADYLVKMKDDTVLNAMSPDSKAVYVTALKNRQKDVLNKLAGNDS